MCSIGGWVSSKALNEEDAWELTRALLWYGASRGAQSAGVYFQGRMLKRAVAPGNLIGTAEFRSLFAGGGTYALTHTRFPTCGGTGDAQAQPFQNGHTVSVHNGMYWDVMGLRRDWGIKKPSGVDSELVCSFVEKHGVMRLPDFLESTDGPSAIACWHKGSMYLMRTGNPCAHMVIRLHDGALVHVFASTADMVWNAACSFRLMPETYRPIELPEGKLYRITPKKTQRLTEKPIKSSRAWNLDTIDTWLEREQKRERADKRILDFHVERARHDGLAKAWTEQEKYKHLRETREGD